ncbi:hypothetical protein DERF_009098 [Dermatophagoides farinae]|uniref:Retroviral polymerase SH3-like domain-containing protein n=1 Tax=Dermatophagoides farinae TaxID=6954 RepID=A0A922L278_DERFA|nr:hypothetical protein DERF_009098 [Dermatophagoides farinae]
MDTAIYIINVWIKGDGISSYEKFFGRKPSYDHLKTYGCVAYYHQPKHLRNKLEETSVKMMFLGYTNSTVNYRLLDPVNLTVITTNDVRFDESELYYTESSDNRFIVQTTDSSSDVESIDLEERVHDIQSSNLFGYSCINSSIIPTSYENALKMSDVEQWKEAIQKEVDQLQKYGVFEKIPITDLGQVHDYLGLSITETAKSFDLCQSAYIRKLLKEFNMEDCKVTNEPMSNLYQQNNEEEVNESLPVQKLLGSLIYIANRTRPDICLAVNWLSRFIKKPTNSLWLAAKQILRFLVGTIEQKLVFGSLDSQIELFTDASFGQGETRHSTSGLLIRSGESILFWRSVKQNKISASSCESESKAILDGYNSVVFIKEILEFIGFKVRVKVKCDNKSANHIFSGSTMKKSKHFNLEIKKIVEIFSEDPDFEIEYVDTNSQLADILTKPLTKVSFERITNKIFG